MTQQNNVFNRGLNLDLRELHQPEGTYRFALNAINESENNSNLMSLSNESGNYECLNLPKNSYPVGSILLLNPEIILFLKSSDAKDSIILANLETCTYQTLLEGDCLNFQNQIQGVYRILNGCDRVIYFVDGLNSDRVVNIDNILKNPTSHSYLNDQGFFDCELIKNKRDFKLPKVEGIKVNNSGGNLSIGVYQLMFNYEDSYGNITDYFNYSLPIPIVYGSYDADYKNITGGDPLLFPNTNKSISFNILGIDQRFNYINLVVGYSKNGITTYYKVDKITIISDNIPYTLSDITIDGTTQLTYDQVIISTNPYDVSETITQTNNRLIKGNVKGKVRDYSEFQRLANQIKVNYVTKAVEHSSYNSSSSSGLSKSSKCYTDLRTEMRDEIYSKSIVWVFKDGTESPAFHIPGRQKNTPNKGVSFPTSDPNTHSRPNNNTGVTDTGWDSALLLAEDTSGNILPDFKFLLDSDFKIISGKKYCERWKAFNTAYRTELNAVSSEYYSKGELAFYESEERYPIVKDCLGNYIYPIEEIDGKVIGQKIRHHKMPDTTLEEHFTLVGQKNYIIPLGLEFNNIMIPSDYEDELLGYYIASEERNHNNKTILDKGIVYKNAIINDIYIDSNDPKDYYVQTTIAGRHHREQSNDVSFIPNYSSIDTDCGDTHYHVNSSNIIYNDKNVAFHGTTSKFYKASLSASFLKTEKILKGNLKSHYDDYNDNDVSRGLYHANYNTSYNKVNQQTNLILEKDPLYIDPDLEIAEGYLSNAFLNNNAQETVVFDVVNPIDAVSNSDAFGNNGEINVIYGSMKVYNRFAYGKLNLRKYFKCHNNLISKYTNTTIIFGGDCFINQFSFFKSSFTKRCDIGLGNLPCCHYKDMEVIKCLVTYFVESEINTELRHIDISGQNDKNNNFWDFFNGDYKEFLNLDWNGKTMNTDDLNLGASSAWFTNTYIKNLYLYNKDFSKSDTVKPNFSLNSNYDFCKDCSEKFPVRIIYSEQSNLESKTDNYRTFLANNYRDLPANTGSITNLFINFDELYAHTEQSLYKIITKPYQINTDQTTLYVGTGEFFSIPPKELVSIDYGYGGSTCKWSTKSTEFGTVFVNDLAGKIFLVGSQLKELSNEGLRNWFIENTESTLNKQYKNLFNIDYPLNNQPAIKNGIGTIATYDPRHKRIIITKKDYYCINTNAFNPLIYKEYDLNNKEHFINKSWTISYSFLSESWISWHSYLPSYYFNDSNNFYSSINSSSKIWKHDKYNYQNFYGKKYDYILEYVLNKDTGITKTLDSIQYISKFELLDPVKNYWIDKDYNTFDRILIYNSYQSTGLRNIKVKRDATENYYDFNNFSFDVLGSKNEKTWEINNFRDLVIDRGKSLFTNEWDEIKSSYFIDKVPNSLSISDNKDIYELERLRDKYSMVRLFSNTKEDFKITTDLFSSLNNISYR